MFPQPPKMVFSLWCGDGSLQNPRKTLVTSSGVVFLALFPVCHTWENNEIISIFSRQFSTCFFRHIFCPSHIYLVYLSYSTFNFPLSFQNDFFCLWGGQLLRHQNNGINATGKRRQCLQSVVAFPPFWFPPPRFEGIFDFMCKIADELHDFIANHSKQVSQHHHFVPCFWMTFCGFIILVWVTCAKDFGVSWPTFYFGFVGFYSKWMTGILSM